MLAGRQTAGRGRHGRGWDSPAGNLHLSVVLRPRGAGPWSLLPLAAGVAAGEALTAFGVDARLKWPNDLVVETRKLGGILVESAWAGQALEFAVVGIGINLAGRAESRPPGLRGTAVSVEELAGRAPDVAAAAAATIARLSAWYERLARGEASPVRDAWRARSLPWWGAAVEARAGDTTLRGVARDIDDDGALVLELPGGGIRSLRSAEVREVRPGEKKG